MTKVGFTGTQHGMTSEQLDQVKVLILAIEGTEFHHGDCIGADEQAALVAKDSSYRVVGHPPTTSSKRAYFNSDEEFTPESYLNRNHTIVDETEILIAAPRNPVEKLRSGTWSTIRYARKKSRKVIIVRPDGSLDCGINSKRYEEND